MPEPEPAEPAGENIPLNIVFEDDEIIVIDKPAGLVVHPAAGHATGTLVNALIAHCGDSLSGIGGVKRPGIVHRLDKDTTGLMVVAKTDRAHQALAAQFADHGRTGPLQARLSGVRLGRADRGPRAPSTRRSTAIPRAATRWRCARDGRAAITHWQVLERYHGQGRQSRSRSLIECRLETGRTHQIRVHLAHIGHPLLGDPVYGPGFRTKAARLPPAAREALEGLGRQALHAYLLAIRASDVRPAKAGVPFGTAGRSCPFTSSALRPADPPSTSPKKPSRPKGLRGATRGSGGHEGVKGDVLPFAPFGPVCCTAVGDSQSQHEVPSARGAAAHIARRAIRGQTMEGAIMARTAALPIVTAEGGLTRYLEEIRRFPMLEPQQEYMLAKRWREHGDRDAAHQLVTSHLRLVAKIAMGYRGYGLPISEVISEGNVGLMQAVKRFEPDKGFRLATYAMWWIKASIQEYILRSWSLVKMGTTANQKKLFFNLRKAKSKISALQEGDLRPDQVQIIAKRLGVTEQDVVDMNRRLGGDASLNAPIRDDGDCGEWQDWLADDSESQETVMAEHEELDNRRKALSSALDVLNDRERRIFEARRLADDPVTLEELAAEFGVSRERVRQIEVRAFEKVQKAVKNRVAAMETPKAAPQAVAAH